MKTLKNSAAKVFKRRSMAVYITSLIVFLIATGVLLYQGTKKTVALALDGKEQVVKTHASTIQDLFDELDLSVNKNDYIHPARTTKVSNELQVTWKPAKEVTINQDGVKKKIWTTSKTVGDMLKEQNIDINANDKISQAGSTTIKDNMEIAINKAFILHVVDGGVAKKVWSTSTTVADFLKKQGISLQPLDRVEPSLYDSVKEGSVVNVVRVKKVTDVVEEPINYDVVSRKDHSLAEGNEKVISEGKAGLLSHEYEVITENGKEVKRSLVAKKVVQEKQDKIVAVGTKSVSASAEPVSLTDRKNVNAGTGGREIIVSSTAYTAGCNGCSGTTATGYDLRSNPNAKIIAVDPSVIPLGSKVFVEGYGYAIAADTGGAIRGNKIDVFFSSKSKAYQWGKRSVKIRIIN
ncbi:G5 and 3D domain-containing protein [Bacillus testis]|uniref:G5 and 3D domain-containing protein n=1 Tax=Bacillus testis TaxID=1622072 RepID=UPI001E402593|nr:G5 and 3D domain-containing protein [Bacillus testis]